MEKVVGGQIHWLWDDTDTDFYRHESVFISSQLNNQFGKYHLTIEESPVQDSVELNSFDTIMSSDLSHIKSGAVSGAWLPSDIEVILEQEDVPPEMWSDILISEDLDTVILSGKNTRLYFSTDKPVAVAVGEMQDLAMDEERLRGNEGNLSQTPSDPQYSGPLFTYSTDKSVDSIVGKTLLVVESPINTAWVKKAGNDSEDVKRVMKSWGWRGWATYGPSKTRYVITKTGSGFDKKDEDKEVGKYPGGIITKQRHLRLYDIPDPMDYVYEVAGQAHYDPLDHHQIFKHSKEFAASRKEVEDEWQAKGYSVSTVDIGNQDGFTSSKGRQGQIDW